jgi:hypothetical protein
LVSCSLPLRGPAPNRLSPSFGPPAPASGGKSYVLPMFVCGVRQIFVERYPIWLRHVVCCWSLRPGDRQQTWCAEVWRPNRHLTRLRLGFFTRSPWAPWEHPASHMNQGGTAFGEIGIRNAGTSRAALPIRDSRLARRIVLNKKVTFVKPRRGADSPPRSSAT